MSKQKFNVTVFHTARRTYSIPAEDWRGAVEKASERADRAGLDATGTVAVYDADMNPVDTRS